MQHQRSSRSRSSGSGSNNNSRHSNSNSNNNNDEDPTGQAPAAAPGQLPATPAPLNSNKRLGSFVIPIRSDSTDWNSTVHDYGTALEQNLTDRSRNMAALMDLNSPTSIYTTESADEVEADEEEQGAQDAIEKGAGNDYDIIGGADAPPSFPTRNYKGDPSNIPTRQAVNKAWTQLTEGFLHRAITKFAVLLSTTAAKFPFTTIFSLAAISLAVLGAGFFTNFKLIVDSDVMFTPINSPPTLHHEWLKEESGFNQVRPLMMILHKNGDNVLGKKPLVKLFEAVDTVRDTFGYEDLCEQGSYVDFNGESTCRILAATRFWEHDTELFHQQVVTDQDAIDIMSNATYSDGQTPVFREMILGNAKMTNRTFQYRAATNTAAYIDHAAGNQRLHFVQSYVVRMELPNVNRNEAELLETLILNRLKDLKYEWEQDPSVDIQLDFLSIFAYQIENQRALLQDLPLIVGIFLVLVVFTTLVFHKRHKVYSRSMLGCASLLAIGFSLCLSYGIVWLLGVPFTNIAQILPFMVMGVGLDDTFIITGEYFRTDPTVHVVKRVEDTMQEVGLSITMTSLTTMLAFALGSLSTIPGVRWLCFYAFAAVATDYFFQITFFVALLVLDERRVQAHQQNCCFWRPVPRDDEEQEDSDGDNDDDKESDSSVILSDSMLEEEGNRDRRNDSKRRKRKLRTRGRSNKQKIPREHFSERLMIWYGDQLMRPIVKLIVLLGFAAYFGFCLYRATLLTQEFNVEDYVPSDSYLRGTLHALDEYYSLTKPLEVYFRDVDQSDPDMQQQMRNYINEMASLPQIGEEPPFCWVRDFPTMQDELEEQYAWAGNLTFTQKLNVALTNPTIREIYGEDIVRDEDGNITASRCLLFLRNVNLDIVTDQIDMLHGQREVTKRQPINQDRDEWAFFSFDTIFFYWELYAQAVEELLFTIVSGIIAVTIIAFILIPHWSAVFFVLPGICILYCNFLGTMQLMGLHINSLTYVIVVMAIGILVDFLSHILLRYYETTNDTREEKVKETLRTMGASMFVGGLTTFLSVCPLVLSTTHIFMTVFWAFAGIVALGFTHGLILLPVILSFFGPVATHQGPPPPVKIPEHIAKELSRKQTSTSSPEPSPVSSTESKEMYKSSTEEDLEVLKPNVQSEESLVKGNFTYEEQETGQYTKKKKKKHPTKDAPSDELSQSSSREAAPPALAPPPASQTKKDSTGIAEPTGVYCGLDLSRFSIYNTSIVKACADAECKSPTNLCRKSTKSRNDKRDPSPSRPRRSSRDPSPSRARQAPSSNNARAAARPTR